MAQFIELIETKDNCYLIYEDCLGQEFTTFHMYGQKIPERTAFEYFRQIIEMIKALDKCGIPVHFIEH